MRHLSKSKIISYLQCPKRLWLQVYKPDEAKITESSAKSISIGYDVGDVARKLYPDGKLVGSYENISESIEATQSILRGQHDTIIFEAAFSSEGILVFADVIEKLNGNLRLIEVKSSTSVKDYHMNDVAIQAWVMRSAGYNPGTIIIRHINNEFIYPGNGNYNGLFTDVDVTDKAKEIAQNIPIWISKCCSILDGGEPVIEVGDQCEDPFPCEFTAYCRRNSPPEPEFPLTILPRGRKVVKMLAEKGYNDLREVPEQMLENENHRRVWSASKSGNAIIDHSVRKVLAKYDYPRYFLDFEGINFAVPILPGTKPYQQVPFQYSCHIDYSGGKLEHHSYLHTTQESPIRPLVTDLLQKLGQRGPIFVYNQAYEKTVLSQMAELLPDLAGNINSVIERIVDLLPITIAHYYHPKMMGSWSIKAVLPTIAPELGYDNLDEVTDGCEAQNAFIQIINPETTESRRQELISKLQKYCERDTLGLVAIMDFLEKGEVRKF